MNELGVALVSSAVQVTLLAVAAMLLYGMSARRRTGAETTVLVAALAASLIMTGLVFCPLPAWWTWEPGPGMPVRERLLAESRFPEPTDTRGVNSSELLPPLSRPDGAQGWSLALLRQIWRQ